ncbi:hypothetical protein OPKNFCMD_6887 [Methylobacterium crusticola]|uniref:Uncharacterized protein n=1 Tax=Methylobacterium crusticola TaxID=1697972 RepID=A0ABQ4R8N5_9HYPH|nr:hypothetical protein [Methylobacterium crusticola]GJD54105.1 hypothetical protein OPKNFCMD_6887 [Methylobacterium crusticola]
MAYTLVQLAPGSYDVDRDGSVIASLAREPGQKSSMSKWHVELLEATPRAKRPLPFTDQVHTFASFEEAVGWLGATGEARECGSRA